VLSYALVLVVLLLAGGCSAGGDASYRAPAGLLLARPAAEGEEEQNPTVEVLLELIWNTPAGERIRIVGNSFSFVPVGVRRFVLTGSDNDTTKSLDRPEVVLRLDGDRGPTFGRYERWVDALVARGEREDG